MADIADDLFNNVTMLKVGRREAPIAGFLQAQQHIRTKYAVLMHNDAYPMERQFVCELYRALEAHPEYPIAAPQIYEVRWSCSIALPYSIGPLLSCNPLYLVLTYFSHLSLLVTFSSLARALPLPFLPFLYMSLLP